MYDGYENDQYYYEAVLMLRKLAFLGGVNIFPFNGYIRTMLLLVATFFFLCVHATVKPFDNRSYELLDKLECSALIAVLMSLVSGILVRSSSTTTTTVIAFVIFVVTNLTAVVGFVYAFCHTFFRNIHVEMEAILGMKHEVILVGMDSRGPHLDISSLTDAERNYVALIIAEIVDLLNDTRQVVSLETVGLIMRAAASYAIEDRYNAMKRRLTIQSALQNKNPLQQMKTYSVLALSDFKEELFGKKQISEGRGTFVEPRPLEGEVTVEELHHGWLTIEPHVASQFIALEKYGHLSEAAKARTKVMRQKSSQVLESLIGTTQLETPLYKSLTSQKEQAATPPRTADDDTGRGVKVDSHVDTSLPGDASDNDVVSVEIDIVEERARWRQDPNALPETIRSSTIDPPEVGFLQDVLSCVCGPCDLGQEASGATTVVSALPSSREDGEAISEIPVEAMEKLDGFSVNLRETFKL
jgi:hypothetical protein